MPDKILRTETIVNALLQVSDTVVEVSRTHILTKVWNAPGKKTARIDDYTGYKIGEIRNDTIFKKCDELIEDSFVTGQNHYLEYSAELNGVYAVTSIRILAIHPDKNSLFIVYKNITDREGERITEDKWKLALDASGDGVWDTNIQTGNIFFSEKWHEIFGYDQHEIQHADAWASKVHPDDLVRAQQKMNDYLDGKAKNYSAELRYLCKDGTYKWILSRGVLISRSEDGKPMRFLGTHTDIHERKLAEEEYHNNAQLLATLLSSLKDGIIVTEEDGKIIYANEAFCSIYGIEVPPLSVIGTYTSESLKKRKVFFKEPEKFYQKTEEMRASSEMILNEEWEMTDGRVLSRDYIPVFLKNGRRIGIWKLADITDLKNTEAKLAALRVFYEQILDHIAADIVVFDKDHRYLFLNPMSIRDPELRKWMVGKTDEDYCRYRNRPMSIAARRRETFNIVKETKQTLEWEERLETPSGEIEYHLRTMAPVLDAHGEVQLVIGYGIDITDRIKAQEALKTSRETFESAFDYSGVGMALISPYGKWLDVNKVICELTGYTKDELLGHNYLDITYPEDKEVDRELINKMLHREISTYSIEKRYVSKKEKIVLALVTVSLVWNADDTPKFFIVQMEDITKKKELENEIYRKNAELEAARESLINKINQLEELSHIIAHNLRGPAGNISLLSEALLAKVQGRADDNPLSSAFTMEEALGFMKDSSLSLMNSLKTLMEITEIKLNKDVPYDDCNVAEIIDNIMLQLHGTIYEKKAIINTDLQVTCIKYPKAYLESILYNFISNALKYSHEHVPPVILVTTKMVNDRVQVTVKDNGIGIDMEKYGDRVFKLNEVFHQGYDSKGVGLYITKTQVESFGGSVDVHSAPDKGSEFIVTL